MPTFSSSSHRRYSKRCFGDDSGSVRQPTNDTKRGATEFERGILEIAKELVEGRAEDRKKLEEEHSRRQGMQRIKALKVELLSEREARRNAEYAKVKAMSVELLKERKEKEQAQDKERDAALVERDAVLAERDAALADVQANVNTAVQAAIDASFRRIPPP
ncbi:unnamed protein product [Tilletia controversa]|uniref:Uncharacterized protein n=1 Tax=Tilletia caries TaxID=13290 RepID=A0A8T8ST06_9BASI|nr:hypothetical protein CF328_g7555 [Tilletia controversa]KAE8247956.1 hypothetical protein A4X03_0g6911 [Tilletia caries]CAD6920504.1 unnamed protein product [Tilletia laevis]CAD6912235.1 unnamed protein product [Tilletia caries]CAD6918232.1 unnamed protein product [Tilletia controversa]